MDTNVEPSPFPLSALMPKNKSTQAAIALVLGIMSLLCCCFFAGIPAIILGKTAMQDIDEEKGDPRDRSLAKTGFILGIVGTSLSILFIIFYLTLLALGLSHQT